MHYHLDQLDFGLWVIVAENTGSDELSVMEVIILHSNNSRGRMGFRQDTIKGLLTSQTLLALVPFCVDPHDKTAAVVSGARDEGRHLTDFPIYLIG